MSEKVSRTLTLKVARCTPDVGRSLSDLLIEAYRAAPYAADRQMELGENTGRYRVLNVMNCRRNVCVGVICGYTRDANQNAVDIAANNRSYPISVLAPQRDAQRHLEFVEGLVYIAVLDNYVALMTQQSITHGMIEEFLAWFINRHTAQDVVIALDDPQRPDLRNYDMSNAKSLVFRNDVSVSPSQYRGSVRSRATGAGWSVIETVMRALGREPPDFGELRTEHDLDQLSVEVSISAKRLRSGSPSRHDAMETIANALRDVENPPVTFLFKDGTRITLSEYRVAKRVELPSINKIPDSNAARIEIDKWIREQVRALSRADVREA